MPQNKNMRYEQELEKCIGSVVEVVDGFGKSHFGTCIGISNMHLNVVLMTETTKVIIKNISSITRNRNKDFVEEKKGDEE